jgi:hypothetical protein
VRKTAVILPPVIAVPTPGAPPPAGPLPTPAEVTGELFRQATLALQVRQADALHYVVEPGVLLRHACAVRLLPSLARLKIEGFREHWNAALLEDRNGAFVFQVPLARSFWQRCLGREPALEVHLRLAPPREGPAGVTEVGVEIRPVRCPPAQTSALLAQEAPQLLQSLRSFLQVDPERRLLGRVPFPQAVAVFPVLDGHDLGDPLVCQGKDVSVKGIAFFTADRPASERLYVQSLLSPELAQVAVLGKVIRVQRGADGSCEVAVVFAETPESWLGPTAGGGPVR